jgi:hypothetical protein
MKSRNDKTEAGGQRPRRFRRVVLVAAAAAALAAYLVSATVAAQGRPTVSSKPAGAASATVTWDGKRGGEYADQTGCGANGAYWLWILTPGGNKLASASLTVYFADGSQTSADGYFPGGGDGSLHFDVTYPEGEAVASASALVDYTGSKLDKMVLTISHAYCTSGAPSTSVPTPGSTQP